MKTRVYLTIGLLSLAAMSCKKDLDLRVGAADKTGTLTLCVNSSITGKKLPGVKVVVVGSPKDSTTTDSYGIARLKLQAGTYELKLTAFGYASIYSAPIDIKPLNGESDTPIFGETHEEIDMYAIGATITGRVVMESEADNENFAYVKDAQVAITSIDGYKLIAPLTATTDANGLYTLKAPINGEFSLDVSYLKEGRSYNNSVESPVLHNGETIQLPSVRLVQNAFTYAADRIVLPERATDPLRITFPVAISTAFDFNDRLIYVSGADSLRFNYTDNNRTVLITPLPRYYDKDELDIRKKWATGTHTFRIDGLKGTKGEFLNASGSFYIQSRQ